MVCESDVDCHRLLVWGIVDGFEDEGVVVLVLGSSEDIVLDVV